MVRILFVSVLAVMYLRADSDNNITLKTESRKLNIYERDCLSCHKQLSFTLEKIFFDYLLKYSSEVSVKSAMIDFLKAPNEDTSIMPKTYIKNFGLKNSTDLNDTELKKAIDIYWEKYKVFGKLK
jgi:hypothetical protein